MSTEPESATKSSWIRATRGKVYVAPGCSSCAAAAICEFHDGSAEQCPLALGTFRRLYRSGAKRLKDRQYLLPALERYCDLVGQYRRLRMERAAAVRAGEAVDGQDKQLGALWREASKCLREAGLAGHLDLKEEQYDQALFS